MTARRLAAVVARLRWPLVGGWLVALVVAGVAALPLAERLSGGGWYRPGSSSQAAAEALRTGFADRGASNVTIVVRDDRHAAASAEFDRRVADATREVLADPRLKTTGSYGWLGLSGPARARFVGADHRTAITQVGLRLDDGTARRILPEVQRDLTARHTRDGLRVALVSSGSFWGAVNQLSADGLRIAELVTFPLILFILLWLYRGAVAAAASLVVGAVSIVVTFGVLAELARHVELSIFVQNAATMIGLGVSVDYSLFVISRYAEEITRTHDRVEALAATLRTSGRTVVFSGGIVVLAMTSLFLIDLNVIRSIALGVVVVVLFAVLTTVVLLPAVLYLLGDRITHGRLRRRQAPIGADPSGGRWHRLARRIMARPVPYLTVAVLALLALAVPALDLRTFTPDARIVPASSPVRWGYDTVRAQYGPGAAAPIEVVVTSPVAFDDPGAARGLTQLRDRLARLPHVTRVDSGLDAQAAAGSPGAPAELQQTVDHFLSADRRTAVIEVVADDYAASAPVRTLLTDVRAASKDLGSGLHANIGGETAEGIDANAAITDRMPLVLAVMLGIGYLVLLVAFRSLLLPLKAIAMNLLSLGATYGVLVMVFQWGVGAGVLGVDQVGHLQNFVPVLLVAILFSLSTDYEVFLLNRVKEEHDAGAPDSDAVATGVARTAPLISGAALLMIAVFGAFAFTGILPIQQLGLGLAIAIALDATVIRLVVVPAAMRLMGRWNWWLPMRRGPQRKAETPVLVTASRGL
ncbi:MMPL family transporter [Krasilnikovia sp. MM14-A1259]|uniref:MMPL family transporter n=1 Tax=Krasilnikovia sp. MM14-A1259 TaxID=3373539 RepID=UPI003826304B